MMFVEFWDMHSGGDTKLPPVEKFFIEAEDEDDGIRIFKLLFKRDPYNITCDCCGPDYAVQAYDTLEEATAFHRGVKLTDEGEYDWSTGISVDEYMKREDVKVVFTFPRS